MLPWVTFLHQIENYVQMYQKEDLPLKKSRITFIIPVHFLNTTPIGLVAFCWFLGIIREAIMGIFEGSQNPYKFVGSGPQGLDVGSVGFEFLNDLAGSLAHLA